MGAKHHPLRRGQRVKGYLYLGNEGKRSFAAAEEFAEVDGPAVSQCLVYGVAATAAAKRPVRVVRLYEAHCLRVVAPALELRINAALEVSAPPLCGVELRPVGQQALELQHVVPGGTIHQRVCSTRIVAHHSAYAAAVARRSLRAEEQPVRLKRQVQLVADHARLHPRPTLLSVDFQYMVEVPADVHHYAVTDHLPRYGRAAGARDEAGAPLPGQEDELADVPDALGIRNPGRHLAVNAGVCRIGNLVDRIGKNLHGRDNICYKDTFFPRKRLSL